MQPARKRLAQIQLQRFFPPDDVDPEEFVSQVSLSYFVEECTGFDTLPIYLLESAG